MDKMNPADHKKKRPHKLLGDFQESKYDAISKSNFINKPNNFFRYAAYRANSALEKVRIWGSYHAVPILVGLIVLVVFALVFLFGWI
ncbi:hypothetical protein FGF1_33230 [Flavobacteriaceae bacterium GF1]